MARNDQASVDRIWEVVEKARVCMTVSQFSDGLRVRPMEALPEREENVIFFLTDRRGLREDDVEVCPEVYMTFVYPNENVYLALTGEAFVVDDLDCARRLWDRQQDGWLSGPTDPNLMIIRVELWSAEMWDGPANCAVADFQFAKARLFGIKANLGDSEKVSVEL